MSDTLPPTNWWMLNLRSLLARSLLAANERDAALALIEEIVADYRSALGPGHPHAMALEVERAALELAAGRAAAADRRLARARAPIEAHMAAESRSRRLLDCLERGRPVDRCRAL